MNPLISIINFFNLILDKLGLSGLAPGWVGAVGSSLLVVYFLPSIIAVLRRHGSAIAIILTNIFLGLTGVGWVIALIWSATARPNRTHTVRVRSARKGGKPETDMRGLAMELTALSEAKDSGFLTSAEVDHQATQIKQKYGVTEPQAPEDLTSTTLKAEESVLQTDAAGPEQNQSQVKNHGQTFANGSSKVTKAAAKATTLAAAKVASAVRDQHRSVSAVVSRLRYAGLAPVEQENDEKEQPGDSRH